MLCQLSYSRWSHFASVVNAKQKRPFPRVRGRIGRLIGVRPQTPVCPSSTAAVAPSS